MRTGTAIWMAAFAFTSSAGCVPGPNEAACRAYAAHVADLTCAPSRAGPDAVCPRSLDNDGAANCVAFFQCLESEARCDDETYVSGATHCGGCTLGDE